MHRVGSGRQGRTRAARHAKSMRGNCGRDSFDYSQIAPPRVGACRLRAARYVHSKLPSVPPSACRSTGARAVVARPGALGDTHRALCSEP